MPYESFCIPNLPVTIRLNCTSHFFTTLYQEKNLVNQNCYSWFSPFIQRISGVDQYRVMVLALPCKLFVNLMDQFKLQSFFHLISMSKQQGFGYFGSNLQILEF